jgi:hypothetical protein
MCLKKIRRFKCTRERVGYAVVYHYDKGRYYGIFSGLYSIHHGDTKDLLYEEDVWYDAKEEKGLRQEIPYQPAFHIFYRKIDALMLRGMRGGIVVRVIAKDIILSGAYENKKCFCALKRKIIGIAGKGR